MVDDRLLNHCKKFSLRNSHQGQDLWYFCLSSQKRPGHYSVSIDQVVTDNTPSKFQGQGSGTLGDYPVFTPYSTESNVMHKAVSNSDVMVDELCKSPKCLFFFPIEASSELNHLHFFLCFF